MLDTGLVLTLPLDKRSVKVWMKLSKRKKPFPLPAPIGGKWLVRSIETTSGSSYLGIMSIGLDLIISIHKNRRLT